MLTSRLKVAFRVISVFELNWCGMDVWATVKGYTLVEEPMSEISQYRCDCVMMGILSRCGC